MNKIQKCNPQNKPRAEIINTNPQKVIGKRSVESVDTSQQEGYNYRDYQPPMWIPTQDYIAMIADKNKAIHSYEVTIPALKETIRKNNEKIDELCKKMLYLRYPNYQCSYNTHNTTNNQPNKGVNYHKQAHSCHIPPRKISIKPLVPYEIYIKTLAKKNNEIEALKTDIKKYKAIIVNKENEIDDLKGRLVAMDTK